MNAKSDFPALRMKVERGHLVPAGPFDAERLTSYRNGTVVFCRFTEERDRVLVKKWWAILGLVVKQCDTPWKTKEEASEAIKLALGIVNLSKTVGGQFMQYAKSLTELEDPEMTEALENMTELLSRMTGVDVATLKKETSHIVDHDHETGEITEHETTESGPPPAPDATELSPSSVAEPADESPRPAGSPIPDATDPNGGPASGEDPAGGEIAPAQPPAGSDSERDILIRFARDILPQAADINVSAAALKAIEKRWGQGELAPLSEEAKETARQICVKMRKIANATNAPATLRTETAELADVLGCSPADIGG